MEKRERRHCGFGMEMMEKRGGGFAMDKKESALASKRGEVGRPACVGRKGHEQEGDALEVMEEEVGGSISVHGDAATGTPLHTAHLDMPRPCHMVAEAEVSIMTMSRPVADTESSSNGK
ncbi:hypothetical protein TRIUR3_29821 [Triticum urartu]|uniref:Uncharacterized protein n=1 Tax=Triticum urartu TaxID=4572 RepID=M7ZLP5_TRIUA|nr:hypothetical protein TRIUR3_29821 [Triticum urartu]